MLNYAVLSTVLIGACAGIAAADCYQVTEGIVVEGPVWSPDGNTIAFHSGSVIYTFPVGGGPMTQVVDDGSWPTWSPDGTRLAYARSVGANPPDIWVVDLQDGDLQQITTWSGSDTFPDWSHGGDKIAYQSTRDDHVALYVYSFQTGVHSRLTTLEGSSPDWSRHDDRIVFERNAIPEGADIVIVDYPSGIEHQVLGQQRWLRYPRWHPGEESLILIASSNLWGLPAVAMYRLPSGPPQNVVCCLTDAAYSEWDSRGWLFSLVDDGNLVICNYATPVSLETWGGVKSRFAPK
jgi:Tol biopolymer transport system component